MKLISPGWSDTARSGLEQLIAAGSGKGLPVVFDFDNTIVCGDMGEATLALLARDGAVRKDGIPEVLAPPLLSRRGTRIRIQDCPDITVYYEELLEATRHHGYDPAPLSNGYVWAVEIMQGLPLLDLVRATEKVNARRESHGEKMIEVTPGVTAYPVPFFYPEMLELIAALLVNRYDVWIVSASNVWTIRWMALRALNSGLNARGCGRGIEPDHVIGVSTLLTDREGRLYKDPLLVREDRRYAGMEDELLAGLMLTGWLNFPVPIYSGKVANIMDLIGKRPYLAVGDSPGDLPMLAFSENRLWIARLEQTGYQREMAARTEREDGGRWLVQPALCRTAPGFIGNAGLIGPLFNGEIPGTIADSAEVISKFL